jgi:hypothetical protein
MSAEDNKTIRLPCPLVGPLIENTYTSIVLRLHNITQRDIIFLEATQQLLLLSPPIEVESAEAATILLRDAIEDIVTPSVLLIT